MTFKEICEARYSVRAYRPDPVPQEKLDYIKECVRLAPSAVNFQPWQFYYLTSPEDRAKLALCYKREWFVEAPAYVLACKKSGEAWTRRYDNHNHADIDIAIAVEHLCLAATEQGLGTCWVCNFNVDICREQFPLPEGMEPAVIIPIGFPANDEPTPKNRKAMDEIWSEK